MLFYYFIFIIIVKFNYISIPNHYIIVIIIHLYFNILLIFINYHSLYNYFHFLIAATYAPSRKSLFTSYTFPTNEQYKIKVLLF